eukprot:CAMPEP_0196663014 /NCGR_PEP_ID=MMETSP1086-20130531/51184_1 /TAXON_ID=77921 /ORGANISM="Cyanoptyche  gloeocystis , Strain SAG4.97" /LENGTH=166 /DNA_ID=CAMNT_0041998667 /DNA_START=75 /DNA_END=575 /DNA_ORIENTATION=-
MTRSGPSPKGRRNQINADLVVRLSFGDQNCVASASDDSSSTSRPSSPTSSIESDEKVKNSQKNRQNLYKTELCRSWQELGQCRYGTKCQFAHGLEELRALQRHPRYKSMQCVTFHTVGTCAYGHRCRFSHSVDISSCPQPQGPEKRLKIFREFTDSETSEEDFDMF